VSLPVVDLGLLFGDNVKYRAAVAAQIGAACRADGFFYVTGHGGEALFAGLRAESERFFALPLEERMAIAMANGGPAWRGYFPVGGELTSGRPDLKQGLYLGEELDESDRRVAAGWPMHGANQWPAAQPELRPAVTAWMDAMTDAGHALMEGVALSLGLPDRYFHDRYTADPTVLFRIFHYPATPPKDGNDYAFGVGEHTDYGLLTLLAQDANGGLQIKGRDGVWFDAPPIPGALVVNIGDMLDRLTQGLYRSAPHRVVNTSGRDRLSWPLFFDPAFEAVVEPLPLAAGMKREARWDEADLGAISGPYGDYLLGKVGKVFPGLKASLI
jgi:isopenicillin N synthase-like dioxygenase